MGSSPFLEKQRLLCLCSHSSQEKTLEGHTCWHADPHVPMEICQEGGHISQTMVCRFVRSLKEESWPRLDRDLPLVFLRVGRSHSAQVKESIPHLQKRTMRKRMTMRRRMKRRRKMMKRLMKRKKRMRRTLRSLIFFFWFSFVLGEM